MQRRILILGGTTEARLLAQRLADRTDFSVILSLAGRTEAPLAQPVPVRRGGFGGVDGLAAYLRSNRIDILIDATHPYAAQISANAAAAAGITGVPFLALQRPAWQPVDGDRWRTVDSIDAAIRHLGEIPRRVFLALGRRDIAPFTTAPQHNYLIRSVDRVDPPLALPAAAYVLARGPFPEAEERALLETHRIETIVARNSGGSAAYGKLAAARALGIEVVLLRRPPAPLVPSVETVDEAVSWLDHDAATDAASCIERGV
jgi:precorrin-6A/cobalt-precorrin-6A reductase